MDVSVEIERVLPVLQLLSANLDVPLSIDTRRAAVAQAALEAGASIVNDVSALADPEMAAAVAGARAGLVLMHMRGVPATMQKNPHYDDVASEVTRWLGERVRVATEAGVALECIVVDPGIGFGKSYEHNLELISRLAVLATLGRPVMLGPSRKAFLGHILGGAPAERRDVATAATCAIGLMNGARLFRVHDVRPVRDALQVAEAIRRSSIPAD